MYEAVGVHTRRERPPSMPVVVGVTEELAAHATRGARGLRPCATRRRAWAGALVALCALAAAACQSTAPGAPAASPVPALAGAGRPPVDMARLHVLMINGGGRPALNYQAHLLPVPELLALPLQGGVHPHPVSVFTADG